jgi:hypothetical protein
MTFAIVAERAGLLLWLHSCLAGSTAAAAMLQMQLLLRVVCCEL